MIDKATRDVWLAELHRAARSDPNMGGYAVVGVVVGYAIMLAGAAIADAVRPKPAASRTPPSSDAQRAAQLVHLVRDAWAGAGGQLDTFHAWAVGEGAYTFAVPDGESHSEFKLPAAHAVKIGLVFVNDQAVRRDHVRTERVTSHAPVTMKLAGPVKGPAVVSVFPREVS